MNKKKILSFVFLSFVALGASACSCSKKPSNEESELTKLNNKINENLKSAVGANILASITDGDVLVYENNQVITVTSDEDSYTATVSTTKKQLAASFELKESTKIEDIENYNMDNLLSFVILEDKFESFSLTSNELTGVIKNDQAAPFFNISSFDSASSVNVTFTLEGEKLMGYVVNYQTSSSKNVTITATYTY